MALVLHSAWRATAPYRVRIGLNLKGLAYDYVGVDLLAGEARREPYLSVNRQGLLPALETDDGVLTQSLAILEWLEETQPEPPLLPASPRDRASTAPVHPRAQRARRPHPPLPPDVRTRTRTPPRTTPP